MDVFSKCARDYSTRTARINATYQHFSWKGGTPIGPEGEGFETLLWSKLFRLQEKIKQEQAAAAAPSIQYTDKAVDEIKRKMKQQHEKERKDQAEDLEEKLKTKEKEMQKQVAASKDRYEKKEKDLKEKLEAVYPRRQGLLVFQSRFHLTSSYQGSARAEQFPAGSSVSKRQQRQRQRERQQHQQRQRQRERQQHRQRQSRPLRPKFSYSYGRLAMHASDRPAAHGKRAWIMCHAQTRARVHA